MRWKDKKPEKGVRVKWTGVLLQWKGTSHEPEERETMSTGAILEAQ